MDVARNGDDDSNNNYDNNNKNILRYLVSFAISDFIYISSYLVLTAAQ